MPTDKINQAEIRTWLKQAQRTGLLTEELISTEPTPASEALLYPSSVHRSDGLTFAMLKLGRESALGVFSQGPPADELEGTAAKLGSTGVLFCPLSHENAEGLRKLLAYTSPSSLADKKATFGVGDRLGLAGPGHARLFQRYNAWPVFAQQSVRELSLTDRSYEEVLDSSTFAVFQEGFSESWGADGDHLKSIEWVKRSVAIGYTIITADVSDHIRDEYATSTSARVSEAYQKLDSQTTQRLETRYLERSFEIGSAEGVRISSEDLKRIVLTYGAALDHAETLYRALEETRAGRAVDFELSVDETASPTSPQAHVFLVLEAQRRGLELSAVAPRFEGEFQKGIDYIGDTQEFRRSFAQHAAIAKRFGHKISIHSGSDKFAVFPVIGELTNGVFHVKTAGTNWLEALGVIAIKDSVLFRDLYRHALERFDNARAYYHITPDLNNIPDIERLEPDDYAALFVNADVRQLLHITYGEMLASSDLRRRLYARLEEHIEDYWQALERHIGRHLDLLRVASTAR